MVAMKRIRYRHQLLTLPQLKKKIGVRKAKHFWNKKKGFAKGIDRRSIRTIKRGKTRILVGCPKGKWKRGKCSVGTRGIEVIRGGRARMLNRKRKSGKRRSKMATLRESALRHYRLHGRITANRRRRREKVPMELFSVMQKMQPSKKELLSEIKYVLRTGKIKPRGLHQRAMRRLKSRGFNPGWEPATSLYDTIRIGDRVTIRTPQGGRQSGRAVMRGPAGWVLNLGGRYGTPGIADERNTVAVHKGGGLIHARL
jgi:hypothetical protein